MNLEKYLIPAKEGFDDWLTRRSKKIVNNHFAVQKGMQRLINRKNDDPTRSLTPVKLVNALHRALVSQGERLSTDRKANAIFARDVVVPTRCQQFKHTVKDTTFVVMGKPSPLRQGGIDIQEIHYLTEGGEKALTRDQVSNLISPKASLESLMIFSR